MKKQVNKYISDYGIPEYWKYYDKTVSYDKFLTKYSSNIEFKVKKEKFSEILKDFLNIVSKKALKAEIVILPNGLGNLGIRKKKMDFSKLIKSNKLSVDWKVFKDTGLITYFTNDHTNGYIGTWVWDKSKCRIPTKTYYKFIASRKNKRAIKKVFENNGDFTELVYRSSYIKKNDNSKTNFQQNSC